MSGMMQSMIDMKAKPAQIQTLMHENARLRRAIASLIEDKALPEWDAERGAAPRNLSYREFVTQEYLPIARSAKKSAHWEEIILRCHLLPIFGDHDISSIGRVEVMQMIDLKRHENYARGSINRMISILKITLSRAAEWNSGGLTESPLRGVRLLADPPKMERTLTPEEAERLMREIRASRSSMLRYIVPFLLFTGARKREALDARWRDVDLARNVWTIPITKSGKPRMVPLSPEAIDVLREVKRAGCIGSQDWIFPSPETGKPYVTIFHVWDRCRRAVGLDDVRIHDLRHSFASALVNRGMTIYDVKEALGHANVVTTQRYAHMTKDRLREAVSQAGSFYGEAISERQNYCEHACTIQR